MSQTPDRGAPLSDDLLERYEAWREQSSAQDPVPPEFAQLAATSALLRETLNQEVQEVPDMAFSAMWSRVQSEIDQAATPWWSRVSQRIFSGWRMPATALAGACGLALVWFVVQPKPSPEPEMRSAMLPESAPVLTQKEAPATVAMQEAPELSEAEAEEPELALPGAPAPAIENIDFAQGGGRIEKIEHAKGTTTVVWIDGARKGPRAKKTMEL